MIDKNFIFLAGAYEKHLSKYVNLLDESQLHQKY